MALREAFRAEGEWLFRWRSYLPLLPLSLVLGVLLTGYRYPGGSATPDESWKLGCFAVSLLGEAVRVLTVGFVPAGTSGRNTGGQLAQVLNTSGMYSVARHPLYLGNYLMWLGVLLLTRSPTLVALVSLLYWLYYERIMFAEEEYLRERFGAAYEVWAARTPAFLPRLNGWRSPHLNFSMRTVLRRELSSMLGLVSVFAAASVASDYGATGRWRLDPLWGGIFLGGLLLFLVLLILKRRTRLLQLPGR
jgi:protein-S-isoprenylcysteine O-methyltransferase Ste14